MLNYFKYIISLFLLVLLSACSDGGDTDSALNGIKPTKNVTILVFGDSLSAGYGNAVNGVYFQFVTPGNTWAELIQKRIKSENLDQLASITVINASIGGEFTAGALQRLPSLLNIYKPTHVLLAHATNDVLSDLPLTYVSDRLESMVQISQNSGAKVMLLDITFAGYGDFYANEYSKIFKNLSAQYKTSYVEVLETIYGNPTYYNADYIHLNDAAQPFMMNNIWNKLIPLLY